jgi:hypothetical protein
MKTQTKHTPGPWTIEQCRNDDGSRFLTINGQGPWGAWLADVQAGNINGKPANVTERHMANARLIAASPDLLSACESALALLTDPNAEPGDADAVTAMLLTAIAKAKGAA